MKTRQFLFAGVAALALAACGGEGGSGRSSTKASSPSAASPLDQKFTLKNAEPLDVDAFFALMPEGQRPKYASAEFDDSIGATVITDLSFKDASDGDTIAIDRAELYGVDVDAMKRVNAASEAGVDAPFETLFEKVRLFGVKPDSEGEDAEVAIGAIEIDKLRVRQGGANNGENPAKIFNAFEFAGLYMKDLQVDASEEEGPKVSFAMPDMRVVGVGGGKIGAIVLNDLKYDIVQDEESVSTMTGLLGEQGALIMNGPLRNFIAPGSQKGSLETFVWSGFDLSGLLEYGLKDEKPAYTAKDLVRLGSIEASNMETLVNGEVVYTAEKASLTADESAWLIPTKVRGATENAVYNFKAYVPQGEEALQKIVDANGLDEVRSASDLAWDWNAEKGGAAFSTSFEMDGLADIALGFDLGGLQIEKLAAMIEAGEENPVGALGLFERFNLTLEDEKMLDVIFDIAALQMGGGTGADVRQSAPAMVRLSSAQAASINPKFGDYANAFAAFLEEGGTLEVNAAPSEPVALAAIAEAGEAGPGALPDVINLTVTHKK